jgi:perosamine synthetase
MAHIPVYQPSLDGKEKEYVLRCLETSWISSLGEYIDRFEKEFSNFVGAKHAISVCNGTVALHLALHCLGIKPGDEVIVPSFTYIASVNTIAQVGATPVFADSSAEDWNVSPEDIERKITSKTKAIMPVHMYGFPCKMKEISSIASRHNLLLVEDCAEALGSRFEDQHVGRLSNVATYSFFGNKTVTTGEGGMVTTDDDGLASALRKTKGQGQSLHKRYWHDVLGFNYRMTNIAAAIGLAQMERVENIMAQKAHISAVYIREMIETGVQFQSIRESAVPSHWLVSILLPEQVNRDYVMARMLECEIETRPTFYCAHEMPMYNENNIERPLYPNAKRLSHQGISLPSWPGLTDDTIKYISDNLKSILRTAKG